MTVGRHSVGHQCSGRTVLNLAAAGSHRLKLASPHSAHPLMLGATIFHVSGVVCESRRPCFGCHRHTVSTRSSDRLLDEVGGRVDWLVLPDPKYRPTGGGQQRIGLSVSTAIASYLSSPVLSVSAGDRVMYRTSVPEATVHEHSDPLTREEDVSGAPYRSNRSSIDKVSKTSSVDRASYRHLGAGVSSLVAAHAGTRSRRGGPGLDVPHSSDTRRRAGKYQCGKGK